MQSCSQLRLILEDGTRRQSDLIEALETSDDPSWIFDQQTLQFLAVNNAALRRYGYSRKEFLALTVLDIRPTKEIPDFLHSSVMSRHSSSRPERWHHQTKFGEVFEVTIMSREMRFLGRAAEIVLAIPSSLRSTYGDGV